MIGKSGEVKHWDTPVSSRIAAVACLSAVYETGVIYCYLFHDLHCREIPPAPPFESESSPVPHTSEKEPPFVPAKTPWLEISQMCFACSGYSLAATGYNSLFIFQV